MGGPVGGSLPGLFQLWWSLTSLGWWLHCSGLCSHSHSFLSCRPISYNPSYNDTCDYVWPTGVIQETTHFKIFHVIKLRIG